MLMAEKMRVIYIFLILTYNPEIVIKYKRQIENCNIFKEKYMSFTTCCVVVIFFTFLLCHGVIQQ